MICRTFLKKVINELGKITKEYDNCSVSKSDCLKRKKEILNIIKKGKEEINNEWLQKPEHRHCIALIMIEQIGKGLLQTNYENLYRRLLHDNLRRNGFSIITT